MDLQMYYQKIREQQTKIADEFPLVVSMETADGGKCGTKTEVPRRLAAKMMVEGLARLASKDEVKAHREALAEARQMAERAAPSPHLSIKRTITRTNSISKADQAARLHRPIVSFVCDRFCQGLRR